MIGSVIVTFSLRMLVSISGTRVPRMGDAIPILGSISVMGKRAGVEYAAKAIPREPVDPVLENISGGSDSDAVPELEVLSKDTPELCSSAMSLCRQHDNQNTLHVAFYHIT